MTKHFRLIVVHLGLVALLLNFNNCSGGFESGGLPGGDLGEQETSSTNSEDVPSHETEESAPDPDELDPNSPDDQSPSDTDANPTDPQPPTSPDDQGRNDPIFTPFPFENLYLQAIGQSNMARYFGTSQYGYAYGSKYLIDNAHSYLSDFNGNVTFVNTAFGNSALLEEHSVDGQNHWLNNSGSGFTPALRLTQALQRMRTLQSEGRETNMLFWAQGEQDAGFIAQKLNNSSDPIHAAEPLLSKYKSGLIHLITEFRKNSRQDKLPFLIQSLGRRYSTSESTHLAHFLVRQIQIEISQEMPDVYVVSQFYDVERKDGVHMSDEAQIVMIRRALNSINALRVGAPIPLGPVVKTARLSASRSKIIFSLDLGSNISVGPKAHLLFEVRDLKGHKVAQVKSIVARGGADFELTLSQNLAAGRYQLYVSPSGLHPELNSQSSLKSLGVYIEHQGLPLEPKLIDL